MRILETDLVDSGRINHRRLSQLDVVIRGRSRITARNQVEPAEPADIGGMEKVVARDQSVLRIDRVIEAGPNVRDAARLYHGLSNKQRIEVGVEDGGTD